jgi:hypothetical protein
MEEILNNNEIQEISEKAKDKIYSMPNIMTSSNGDFRSIAKVSSKGLIFIYGNNDTGLKHINHRHLNYHGNYKLTNGEITNPSCFPHSILPIEFYPKVADFIYCIDNLEKSKDERFVTFSGSYDDIRYRLVLYKGSNIVHTLFPISNKTKRTKKINVKLVLGELGYSIKYSPCVYTAIVPFNDKNNITRYVFHFRIFPDRNLEELWLEILTKTGDSYVVFYIGECELNIQAENYKQYTEAILFEFEKGNAIHFEKLLDKIERRGISKIDVLIEEFNK